MDAADYVALAERKPRKYRNVTAERDGIAFASQSEARRYDALKLLRDAGAIDDLLLQPRFPLIVNGVKVSRYTADFGYRDTQTGRYVYEDVKGGSATKTRAYVIRRKLVKALYGIDIVEVTA